MICQSPGDLLLPTDLLLTLNIELYERLPGGEGRVDHPGVLHPAAQLLAVVPGPGRHHQLGPGHIPALRSLKETWSVRARQLVGTFWVECLSLLPSHHQEILGGGLDPEERQERRCSRPLDRGSSAPSISTVRGPTANITISVYLSFSETSSNN